MELSSLKIKLATVSCMEKLLSHSTPDRIEDKGVTLRNMPHRLQLVIKNLQVWALYNVRVSVGGDIAPYVHLGVIDPVPAQDIFIGGTDDYYLDRSGVYPDVIRPLRAGDIILPPSANKCLWVTVEPNGGDLPVGVHKIIFSVFDGDNKLMGETGYELEVLPARLEHADIKKTNWMHYDCICRTHNVEPFSKEFYKVFDNYLAAFTRSGFNMLLTPLFTPPLDTYVGGERMTAQLIGVTKVSDGYDFDFSKLDEFLDFSLSRGIKYIEFSHLFTQWGGERCPKIIATENGEKKKIFGWDDDSLGEDYTFFLSRFLPKLVDFIKTRGICDKCCFHLTDEPNEKHLTRYKALKDLVKRYIGGLPIIDTLSNYEYYRQGLMDIPVPEVRHIGEFIDNGVENMLVYYCCEPSDGYYSNRFLSMPLLRTRILGTQIYLSGAKGFLHWGFNFYNSGLSYRAIDPYSDTNAGGAFPAGDGFIVYPSADGVNLSMRSETMALCFEDYDLLYTLEKKIGREKVIKMLDNERIEGFTVYPHSAALHTALIEKIKREL